MPASNPRKGSYGYVFRIQTDIDLTDFNNVYIYASASSNGGFVLETSASTAFIGNSTVYARDEGLRLISAERVWSVMRVERYTLRVLTVDGLAR